MKNTVFHFALLVSLSALSSFAQDRVGDWTWVFPSSTYKEIDMAPRSAVDRASKLMTDGEKRRDQRQNNESISAFRAAAQEWDRFGTEFLDSSEEALAYASFLKGYCLHMAKDRNKAIEAYTECVDLYDGLAAAGCAIYWRGCAYGDNGQGSRARQDWELLADSEDYERLPLRFSACNRLASSLWENGKIDEAIAAWQVVADGDRAIHKKAFDEAQKSLFNARMLADFSGVAAEVSSSDKPADDLVKDIDEFRRRAWDIAGNGWWRDPYFKSQASKKFKDVGAWMNDYRKKVLEWFDKQKAAYEAANRSWDHAFASFDFWRNFDKKAASAKVPALGEMLRKTTDDKARDDRAVALIERLNWSQLYTEAGLVLECMKNPNRKAWAKHDIDGAKGDWKAAAADLAPIESDPDEQTAGRAKREHAWICQNRLSEFDTAIKLYNDAPDPPGTLWRIAECYRGAGDKQKAFRQLVEIASVFPNEAARAMLQQGRWYNQDGDKKKAIGSFRQILANAEWKKTQAASDAHQELERLGIATGGAVVNEVH